MLEVLAAQLKSTGTMQTGDTTMLAIGSKTWPVKSILLVSYNNKEYELELVRIERTTFTLRYRGEELTRPIRLTR
jgi:hypothetical protein